jgi:excisionase family DNA binding protein
MVIAENSLVDADDERLLLRGGEVAALMGISRALAFRWMQNGTLPVLRLPGCRTVRVPKAALVRFIEARTTGDVARV